METLDRLKNRFFTIKVYLLLVLTSLAHTAPLSSGVGTFIVVEDDTLGRGNIVSSVESFFVDCIAPEAPIIGIVISMLTIYCKSAAAKPAEI